MSDASYKKNQKRIEILRGLSENDFSGLKIKHITFVREYLKHENGAKAAIAAGYSKNGSKCAAQRILKEPGVIDAINKVKQKVARELEYSHEAAVIEADQLMFEARKKGQFMAVSKFYELKLKLHKLIEDRFTVDHNMKGGFQVMISGIAPPSYALPPIDVTPPTQQIESNPLPTEVPLPNGTKETAD